MSFLSRFRRRDPTHDWPVLPPRPLWFDVERLSLNGIALDGPMEALRELGRPAGPSPVASMTFSYPRSGVVATVARGRVICFTCVLAPEAAGEAGLGDDAVPCEVEVRLPEGAPLRLRPGITRAEIAARLDPLSTRAEGMPEDGWRVGPCWIAAEVLPDGTVALVDLEPAEEG